MRLHPSTFEYLKPTETQTSDMGVLRRATAQYAGYIDDYVPDGPDKTYINRKLRELAMWINVAITRQADGTPRNDDTRARPPEELPHYPHPIRAPHGMHEKPPLTLQEVHDHDPPTC